MATSGGILAPIAMRLLKHAFKKTTSLVKARLAEVPRPLGSELRPVLVRSTPRQPLHPAALLRQSKGRWYTTHTTINAAVRRFMGSGPVHAVKYSRTAFPKSATATAVSRLTSRAPFSSTLRPNLTGGALPRTAGGYTIGGGRTGGARYFSHTPAAPAQVVNNVSSAVRAFCVSGQKAQFDGTTPAGEKRYRSVTTLQDQTVRKMRSVPKSASGSFIDFVFSPTVTALTPLRATLPYGSSEHFTAPTLNTEGFLDVLSVDFSRALKDLAAILNDLKRLSTLGDLPVTLEKESTLRVRFPGCDAETVERLCDEVGVQRGVIHQDADFDDSVGGRMALMFPFAPNSEHPLSSPGGSLRSQSGHDSEDLEYIAENAWLESPEGYESMEDVSESASAFFGRPDGPQTSFEYEGIEGIYRFLEQCDRAKRI